MVKKAIMRRLRLLTHSWALKDNLNKPKDLIGNIKSIFVSDDKAQEQLYDKVNAIQIQFTPNVPQSDEEIMKVIAGMFGIVSDQTLCEMAERLTGVPFEEELKRIKKEFENKVSGIQTDQEKDAETRKAEDDEPAEKATANEG